MNSRYLPAVAWLLLAAVAFSTISPIGLRPMTSFSPHVERFFAFAVVGCAFVLAYPRRVVPIVAMMVVVAVGLELLQLLAVSRHARPQDVAVKLVGAGFGVGLGLLADRLRRRWAAGRSG